jgi:hypothetical protein
MTSPDRRFDQASSERSEPEPQLSDVVPDAIAAERYEANRLMISGAAIGALDVLAIAALGVGCPLCAVGAPALVGWGAWRWWKVRKLERESQEREPEVTPDDGAASQS